MKKKLKCEIKILLFFLFLFIPFFLSATAQEEKRISLDFANVPLSQVLNEIGKQTSLRIIYNTKDVNPDKIVSVKVNQERLASVMVNLLKNTNVAYTLKDDCLVLFSSKEKRNIENVQQRQQQDKRIIKGVISDEFGEPLMGVSIKIQGTGMGTITDLDGNYTIEVAGDKDVLVFSYIGYKTIVLPVVGATSFNIIMKEDSQQLGEVVITAMGIERKAESLTYATQQIGGKELTRAKDVNFVNSLQGKSAGLTITPNSSGAGGGSSKITLRGQSSILGNNQPLIVLDGIPMSNGMSGQSQEILRTENLTLVRRAGEGMFGDYLEFETITLCPICKKGIIKKMLTEEEVTWLNTYHQNVYDQLAPDLNEEEKMWLKEATAAI